MDPFKIGSSLSPVSDAENSQASPIKRGRGRPPKHSYASFPKVHVQVEGEESNKDRTSQDNKSTTSPSTKPIVRIVTVASSVHKSKRGRPRKYFPPRLDVSAAAGQMSENQNYTETGNIPDDDTSLIASQKAKAKIMLIEKSSKSVEVEDSSGTPYMVDSSHPVVELGQIVHTDGSNIEPVETSTFMFFQLPFIAVTMPLFSSIILIKPSRYKSRILTDFV